MKGLVVYVAQLRWKGRVGSVRTAVLFFCVIVFDDNKR